VTRGQQDEAEGLIPGGTPSRAESPGKNTPRGDPSIPTERKVFGDQYATEPEMKIVDEDGDA